MIIQILSLEFVKKCCVLHFNEFAQRGAPYCFDYVDSEPIYLGLSVNHHTSLDTFTQPGKLADINGIRGWVKNSPLQKKIKKNIDHQPIKKLNIIFRDIY